jgi:hypothetical protein
MTMGDRIKPKTQHATSDKPPAADPKVDVSAAPAGVRLEPATSAKAASEKVTTSSP